MLIFMVSAFSSNGYAIGPNDTKDPIQIKMTKLEYQSFGHLANAMIYVKNTSKYEVHDFHATIDLYNKDGKKISVSPVVWEEEIFHPDPLPGSTGTSFQFELVSSVSGEADLQGAYIKPVYTFKLGKKLEPQARVAAEIIAAKYVGSTLHLDTVVVNYGEATATNFVWNRVGVSWPDESVQLEHEFKNHPVINHSFVLQPGQYVKASFDIPNVDPSIPIPELDQLYIGLGVTYDSVAPFQESQFLLVADNKKVNANATIENGTTYVPIRALSEVLGASVTWDEPTQTVTVTKGDTTLRVSVDSNRYYVNDRVITSTAKARLQNDTTFVVPLRVISEALNCLVHYEQNWEKEMVVVIPK